jgi:hypothetical protein
VSASQEVNEDDKALRDEIARAAHERACGCGSTPDPYDAYWRKVADGALEVVQRIIAERDLATRIAASLERECSVRDEALEQIAALADAWRRAGQELQEGGYYERSLSGRDLESKADDIQRILDSLQRRLDPFRDDEGEAQQ